MNPMKFKSLIWLMAGVVAFSACSDDDEQAASMSVSSITTTDGTDLYGATSASSVGADQSVIIGFSEAVNGNTLSGVALKNGDNVVPASVTATGNTVTIDPNDALFGGTIYTVQINNVQSTDGATAGNVSANFTTSGVGLGSAPQAANQTLYLQFNGGIVDITGNATSDANVEQVSYDVDRFGNANGAAYFNGATAPGNGDIVVMKNAQFLHPSTSISCWFKVDYADFPNGTNRSLFGSGAKMGYFYELGNDLAWMKLPTSHMVSPDPNMNSVGTAWNDVMNGSGSIGGNTLTNYTGSISDLVTNSVWHQMVMTYDNATSQKAVYIDGFAVATFDVNNNTDPGAEWNMTNMTYNIDPNLNTDLAIGFNSAPGNATDDWAIYSTAQNTFKGAMDDFRIWNVGLTAEQVTALYNAEKP